LDEIRKRHPTLRVLAMSDHAEFLYAVRARQMGAKGYAAKDASRTDLVRAVRDVMAGKEYFDAIEMPKNGPALVPKIGNLSAREYSIMLALGNGERATDIANKLNLSIKTVSTYKRRILNKLQLLSLADLVRHVMDHKLS
jgi:DNA-binding NarL/FixJ family response regulator